MAAGERLPALDDCPDVSGALQIFRAEVLWRFPTRPGTENFLFLFS